VLTLDDQRPEGTDTTTRNADRCQHEKPKPRLGIDECLQYVVPLPDARCDTHLVHAQTLDGHQLFVIVKKLCLKIGIRSQHMSHISSYMGVTCLDRRVRHENKDKDRHDNCEETAEEEYDLV
jgi:hypothetical protein